MRCNFMSRAFCSLLNEFREPAESLEKALSVGENTVRPWFESLSCEVITLSMFVVLSRRIKVEN